MMSDLPVNHNGYYQTMRAQKCKTCSQLKIESTISFHRRYRNCFKPLPFICKTCFLQLKRSLNPLATEARLRRMIDKRLVVLKTRTTQKTTSKSYLIVGTPSIPYLQRKLKMTREGVIAHLNKNIDK